MKDVLTDIARQDVQPPTQTNAFRFQLKHAPASRVASLLTSFFQDALRQ